MTARALHARRAAAVAGVSALVLPVLAAPALAVNDPVTGYWTRTNVGAPVSLPPPTPVPDGGFLVSGDPAGPVAVSAIRAGADEGSVVAGFVLKISDTLGTPKIVVCPTVERWAPEQGGRLEAAPEADCTSPVETVVEGDTLLVTLPPLLQTDLVDVLLAPAQGAAFSASFERPTAASVIQAPAAAPNEPAPAPLPPASGGGFGSSGPAFESGGFSGGTGFGTPELDAPVAAPELLPAPALPAPAAEAAAVPQPQAAPPAAPTAVLATRPAVPPVDRTASLMAVALLAALAAVALRLAVQPVAPPRHLGGGARLSRPPAPEAVPASVPGSAAAPADVAAGVTAARGVGRFRAPRLHPPVRI